MSIVNAGEKESYKSLILLEEVRKTGTTIEKVPGACPYYCTLKVI
jgi:hypothetical protein